MTSLISFFVSLAIMLSIVGVVNYLRFRSLTEFGYGFAYGTFSYNHWWTGLVGLLISQGKGLIFYFPAAPLLLLVLKLDTRKTKAYSF